MILEFFIIKSKISKFISGIPQKENDKVLDLGCGNEPYYHKCIKGRLICFDIGKTKKTDVVGTADILPFRQNSFDKVLSVNSFYYFNNPFDTADGVSKILKPGGKLIIVLPFFYPIHDAEIDKYRFTEQGLKAVLERHFKIEGLHCIGGIFTLPSVILHSAIKGFPLLFPKAMQRGAQIIAYLLFPLYFVSQLLSLLDFLDKTKRMPAYYFVLASKI